MSRIYTSFRPGKVWLDTAGKPIAAHGFSIPGQLKQTNENTCKARFVWLPIEWDNDKPIIRWHNEWQV